MNFGREIRIEELPDYDTSVVPAGWYTASIAKAEVKDTRRGDGQYVSVQYSILGPTQQGRAVFGNINISNPSETATRIGLAQLRELMTAAGLSRVSDSSQLVGATVQIRVVVRQDDKFGESNEVKGWRAVGAPLPAPRPAASGFAAPAPAPVPAPVPPPPTPPQEPPPDPFAPTSVPRPPLPPWAARK